MSGVPIAILAAGASTRLGQPKQLVPFRGRPLLLSAVEAAVVAGLGPVWVVLGAYADRIRPVLAELPVTIHAHDDWAAGLGGTIASVVKVLPREASGLMLALCDQPGLDATHLRALYAAHEGTGQPIVASAYAEALGVPAFFEASLRAELENLRGHAGARAVIGASAERVATVLFPAGQFDIDTPADLARLASRFAQGPADAG